MSPSLVNGIEDYFIRARVVKVNNSFKTTGPVSYTHLDVYKRQEHTQLEKTVWESVLSSNIFETREQYTELSLIHI